MGGEPHQELVIQGSSQVSWETHLHLTTRHLLSLRRGNDREPVPKMRPESSSGSPSHSSPEAHAKDLTSPDCHSQGGSGPGVPPELYGSGNRQEGQRMDLSQTLPQFKSKRPHSPSSPSLAPPQPHVWSRDTRSGPQDSAQRSERTLTPATQGWTPTAA